jgi:hypothetical protein
MTMIATDIADIHELDEAQLNVIAGGFKISICVGGYCASAGTDGLSLGKQNQETGPSAGAQVYAAVMKGMGQHS